jgi:putative copper resistance protein D
MMATTSRKQAVLPLVWLGAALALLFTAAITSVSGSGLYATYDLTDPGLLTRLGIPVVRTLAEVAAVISVGALMIATIGVPPQESGTLAAGGYRALRSAGWASIVWLVAALLMVPLTIADATGRPVLPLNFDAVLGLAGSIAQSKAWTLTAAIALLVACMCRVALRWRTTAIIFVVAVLGLLPVVLSGHSSSGGAHDLASSSMLLHVVAAALWIGGLIAVLGQVWRGGEEVLPLVLRFSSVALVCWVVLAVSGAINALIRITPADLFGTPYGILLTAKIVALGLLGVLGHQQRLRSIPAIARSGRVRSLVRLGGVEILLMLATVGLAVGLGRTPPPERTGPPLTEIEQTIGYGLQGAPTATRLMFDWRFDLVFGTAAIAAAVVYLLAVRRVRRTGSWPAARIVAWLFGCGVVLVTTSSGIGRYMPAVFSVQLVGHVLLAGLASMLLIVGRPAALLPTTFGQWPRPLFGRVNPVAALAVFTAPFFVLYLSGAMDSMLSEPWGRLTMNTLFLVAGLVFFGTVLSSRVDKPIERTSLAAAAAAMLAVFCGVLFAAPSVIASDFYRQLALPWLSDLLANQRLGAVLALLFAAIPLAAVVLSSASRLMTSTDHVSRPVSERPPAR